MTPSLDPASTAVAEPSSLPDVLTFSEAAAFLRVGPKVLRRLCRLRTVPYRKVDHRGGKGALGSTRFSRAALVAWLQEGGLR